MCDIVTNIVCAIQLKQGKRVRDRMEADHFISSQTEDEEFEPCCEGSEGELRAPLRTAGPKL